MKKLLMITCILSLIFVFYGCQSADVDDNYDDDIGDVEFDDDLIPEDDMATQLAGENNDFDTADDDSSALYDHELYVTRLQEIDTSLRTSIDEIGEYDGDVTDDDYLTSRSDYYRNTATAYQTALDDINNLPYNTEYGNYHNGIISYYQSGYDIYEGLATSYGTFNTLDDEKTYREQVGETGLDISDDIRQTYDDSLLNLGIVYD